MKEMSRRKPSPTPGILPQADWGAWRAAPPASRLRGAAASGGFGLRPGRDRGSCAILAQLAGPPAACRDGRTALALPDRDNWHGVMLNKCLTIWH